LRYARGFLLLSIAGFFVYALWHYREARVFENLRFDDGLLYASGAGSLGLTLCLGALWLFILQHLSGKLLPLAAGFYVHMVGWLGRYTPGKLGLFVGKALLGQKLAGSGEAATASVIYENVLFIASGVVLAASTISVPGIQGPVLRTTFAVIALACLLAAPRGIFWILDRARRWLPSRLKSISWQAPLHERYLAVLCIFYCVPHACAGLGFFALVHLVAPDSGMSWASAIGILTAAHLAGIFAAFAPAGLGVREAALVVLLLPYVPAEIALSLAILARLTSIVADFVVFVMVMAYTPYVKRHAGLF